jgi:hypothetical protein
VILLASDCLLFELANGESVPFTASTISVELIGGIANSLEPEVVENATAAVFHYFKSDLQREMVSINEFATALQKVLRGFGFNVEGVDDPAVNSACVEDDLRRLASRAVGELLFFAHLRDELRRQLQCRPRLVTFHGLRGCVKQLTGARRWSPRCDALRDHIVEYLRQCLSAERSPADCVLMVK